jgi:hypothetical protein
MTALKPDEQLRNLFEALSEHDSDCSKRWWIGEDGQRHCNCGAYEMKEMKERFLEWLLLTQWPERRANDDGAK